jgi:hypothetical protein
MPPGKFVSGEYSGWRGQVVEVESEGVWYAAMIDKCHETTSGKYDITYTDEGDYEQQVDGSRIRVQEGKEGTHWSDVQSEDHVEGGRDAILESVRERANEVVMQALVRVYIDEPDEVAQYMLNEIIATKGKRKYGKRKEGLVVGSKQNITYARAKVHPVVLDLMQRLLNSQPGAGAPTRNFIIEALRQIIAGKEASSMPAAKESRGAPAAAKLESSSKGIQLASDHPMHQIQTGDIVKAKPPDEVLFYEGVVMEAYSDGFYDIDFGDSDEDYIRCTEVQKVLSWDSVEVGDNVKVKYQGGYQEFEAVVIGDHGDQTYDVRYDDDEVEDRVPVDKITKLLSHRVAGQLWAKVRNLVRATAHFKSTSVIEAGAPEKGAAGAAEKAAAPAADAPAPSAAVSMSSTPVATNVVGVGERVLVRHQGGAKSYKGVVAQISISSISGSASYTIRFDDGEVATAVRRLWIRRKGDSQRQRLRVAEEVDALRAGCKRLAPGMIKEAHDDGTYDVNFVEEGGGEIVEKLPRKAIIAQFHGTEAPVAIPAAAEDPANGGLSVGQVVEGRYGGQKQWYKGTVLNVRASPVAGGSNVYHLRYEDGDEEDGVLRYRLRKLTLDSAKTQLCVGDNIDSDYGGRGRLYPGVVVAVNEQQGGTTCDVKYEDGDTEVGIEPNPRFSLWTAATE